MIAILALIALISAFLIASALSRTATDVSNERQDRSMSALRKAKAALIAYAANEQWQLYKALPKTPITDSSVYFQPGALPCPDQNDDGDADCFGSTTASMIGRVPFATLGIEDLRDASGEHLWYALSHDFRKLRCTSVPPPPTPPSPSGCTIINSDTQGQLTVVGIAPATQVVAVLFAPGEAFQLQNRDPANATAHNDPLNYLEGPPDLSNSVNFVFTTAPPSSTFNDRVLVITQAELMAAVEPVVAANIERDIGKGLLQDYFAKWNRYPLAVPFPPPPPAQSDFLGTQTMGLLPVKNDATFTWQNATITQIGAENSTVVDSWSCSISSPTVTCTVHYTDGTGPWDARPRIKLDVFLSNASSAFADAPSSAAPPAGITMLDGWGNLAEWNGSTYGYWSTAGPYSPLPTQAFVGGALTYIGWLQNANTMHNGATIIFSLPAAPGYLPRFTNPWNIAPNIEWFIANQWYRHTYYAMSSGFSPAGVGACNPPTSTAPSCLTVNNLSAPTNDKLAILVLVGRALAGQNRTGIPTPPTLGDYLEGQNSTPVDLIFEHRAGSPTTTNDRVVVVSP